MVTQSAQGSSDPERRTVLVVEDDAELAALLTDYLGREGFAVRVARDGDSGLAQAAAADVCLVLLDIMLPRRDGVDLLRELRRGSSVPVIMLTAKGDDVERIVGLELGADDYVPKPFNPRELIARIRAVLRRTGAPPAPGPGSSGEVDTAETAGERRTLAHGPLVLDLEAWQARLDGAELALTTLEFALLRELMQAAGRALSRETLLDRVRGRDFELYDRSIDVHISHLRQKLGDDPQQPRYIRTVRSVGYLFIADSE